MLGHSILYDSLDLPLSTLSAGLGAGPRRAARADKITIYH